MKMLLALAAGALGYCYYRGCDVNARKARTTVKEEVTRWEGEGGNVPAVATPSPAPQPAASVPPEVQRH
jgi:hypothetical protein